MTNDQPKQRLIDNEETFKRQNEQAKRALKSLLPHDSPISFVCECSEKSCHERIELTCEQYQKLHQDLSCYVVKPGHETAGIEEVAETHDGYSIVKKHDPINKHSP